MTENLQFVKAAQVVAAPTDKCCVKLGGSEDRGTARATVRADRGTSFVELLVAIMLLGTTVVAVLVTLRTSTHASAIDQNMAKAYEWEQSVSDEIYDVPRVPCYVGGSAAAISAYQSAANLAAKPPDWSAGTVTVTNVEFLGRALPSDPFSWSSAFCFESSDPANPYYTSPLYTQRVTFTVAGPPGTFSLTMQVVKSEK